MLFNTDRQSLQLISATYPAKIIKKKMAPLEAPCRAEKTCTALQAIGDWLTPTVLAVLGLDRGQI